MADDFTEVTTTSWGGRIVNSIRGLFFGLLLIPISFWLLYWNEGRVDLATVARTTSEISAEVPAAVAVGTPVSMTGKLSSSSSLGDGFLLKEGSFLAISRKAEMFAWQETKDTQTEKNLGGSETTKTTYHYKQAWTEKPERSSGFKEQEGHTNPEMSIQSSELKVPQAQVGIYHLDMANIEYDTPDQLTLTSENVIPAAGFQLADRYAFKGTGSVESPQTGDLRVSYKVLNAGTTGTAFGKLADGNSIAPFIHSDRARLYRIFSANREDSIAQMHGEYVLALWGFRAFGFVLMWFGMAMVLAPISVVLDFIPLLGSIAGGISGFTTFLMALILSSVTIVVSKVVHSPAALVVSALVTFFVAGSLLKKRKAAQVQVQGQVQRPAPVKSAGPAHVELPPVPPRSKTG